jgi:RNA polymerase sigma factor (TIGR02999 family)
VADDSDDITHWLHRWHEGDPEAADKLFRLILPRLKKIAARRLRHEPNVSLSASEVVNELYEKLDKANQETDWRDSGHLFAIFTIRLGHFIIDHIRKKKLKLLSLDDLPEGVVASRNSWDEILNIDRLLDELEKENFTMCAVLVASHYFGYEDQEIADKLGLSLRTTQRYLHEARKWLFKRLRKK